MLKKYAKTLTFQINRSTLLVFWLIGIHSIAIAAAGFNSLAVIYKCLLYAAILISLIIYLRRSNKEIFVRYRPVSGWEIAKSENKFLAITILPSTVITPYLIVLHFYMQNKKKQTILIARDALINDEFRKLMVELKLSGMNG